MKKFSRLPLQNATLIEFQKPSSESSCVSWKNISNSSSLCALTSPQNGGKNSLNPHHDLEKLRHDIRAEEREEYRKKK